MNKLLISAAIVALTATPANAQLLGGLGGLGGGIGGTLNSTISTTTETVRSTTRGTLDGAASTSGNQRVDRRSGRVEANRSANAAANASAGSLLESPIAPVAGSASGSGNASGQGSASAELIGTDAVRGLIDQGAVQGVGQARGAIDQTRSALDQTRSATTSRLANAGGTAGQLGGGAVGSAMGGASGATSSSASGNGSANGSLLASPVELVAAGSAAANGAGTFGVAPRMPVLDADGARIGQVRQVVTDQTGRVSEVVVRTRDGLTTLPASNFTANGSALVSAMGTAELRRETAEAAAAPQPAPASDTAAQ